MTERPLLMMDSMVLATMREDKTVTRRTGSTWEDVRPGTRLWVREAHVLVREIDPRWTHLPRAIEPRPCDPDPRWSRRYAYYRAGFDQPPPRRWRPSIHMPRWASRLTLNVLRVDREQWPNAALRSGTVDEAEARREGFPDAAAFAAAWEKLHPAYVGPVYRVEFEVMF